MSPVITPQQFVATWRNTPLTERAASQSHFLDLCRLLGQPTPAEADPAGADYAFERGASKAAGVTKGDRGWADVWRRNCFGWEYKKAGANLDKAYQQLLQYRESLENPPLLVVSDTQIIQAHTNITNTVKQIYTWTLDDLLVPARLDQLRRVWTDPFALKPITTTAQVTEQAAQEFAQLAALLRKWGEPSERAAHFLIRLLFCLFAEDVGLLPAGIFTRLVERTATRPKDFVANLRQLFATMRDGGMFLLETIPHFNGGLFNSDDVIELDSDGLAILLRASRLDWSAIEPAILGTLFERSLDPAKRSQLGAHYTAREDILLIVEPVLMAPLRRQWDAVQATAQALAAKRSAATPSQRRTLNAELVALFTGFQETVATTRVLDPACGSGNFLFVALKQLLDLEKALIVAMGDLQLTPPFPRVSPEQLHGIEINEYAHELAQITVWIGYIQWLRDNGFGQPSEPILKPLDTIRRMDAVLAFDERGTPIAPAWPAADVIIGNPPFLGGNRVRQQLGATYVESLFQLYQSRVPAFADFVCYWFERSRSHIEQGKAQRAGLLATNSIRGGANRKVLEHIKQTGDIFMAWDDRPWTLDGAAVRVSLVGFDNGQETLVTFNGRPVISIHPDLTADMDLSAARFLLENHNICFRTDEKGGPFDIPESLAKRMLNAPLNPNGRPNSDVVRPYVNGLDITRHYRHMWIIDFGVDMSKDEAALYEQPFEYALQHIQPIRAAVRNPREQRLWWLHRRPAPDMRQAVASLQRYIATPAVAKHRVFVWLNSQTIPDHQLYAIARDDDYFFGVLHSKLHELWSLRMGTSLEDRPRYTPTTTFETFPFPWAPGREPADDPRVQRIAAAAKDLVTKRDRWLNPASADATTLKTRTLTNLYNERPTWLALAHAALDRAVLDAYGWPHDLGDDDILARLLALNLARAANQGTAAPAVTSSADDEA